MDNGKHEIARFIFWTLGLEQDIRRAGMGVRRSGFG